MHVPPQPFAQLEHLSQALEGSGDDLPTILAVLLEDLTEAVPSFTGLVVTIVARGEPVTIAAVDTATARSSMLLPLHRITDLPAPSAMVFYAQQPGAFAQLAVDVRDTYRLDGDVDLDRHLPPPQPADTLTPAALADRSTIDQAIGALIGQGHTPDEARAELAARAAADNTTDLAAAHHILRTLEDPTNGNGLLQ